MASVSLSLGWPGSDYHMAQFYCWLALNRSPHRGVQCVGFPPADLSLPWGRRFYQAPVSKCQPSSKSSPNSPHHLQGALSSLCSRKSVLLIFCYQSLPSRVMILDGPDLLPASHNELPGRKPCYVAAPYNLAKSLASARGLINIYGRRKIQESREDALLFTFTNKG